MIKKTGGRLDRRYEVEVVEAAKMFILIVRKGRHLHTVAKGEKRA